jgi:hypothetical protein
MGIVTVAVVREERVATVGRAEQAVLDSLAEHIAAEVVAFATVLRT